jgi:putative endonuclease
MYSVYVLKSRAKNYLYVGLTNNIARRFKEHNQGYSKITKPYRPLDLVYSEKCGDRLEARKREKYLKSGCGKEWIKGKLQSA